MKTKGKSSESNSIYFIEGNRLTNDSIRIVASTLRRYGIAVGQVPHKTTLKLERSAEMSWKTFLRLLKKFIQPKIGSLILFSCSTGKVFICNNTGNRPNLFIEQ